MMAKYFTDLSAWRELLAGDFNRGYLSGVLLVLAVVLLMLVLRLLLSFLFRNRRVRSMVVPAADGEVMISRNAVIAAVESMLTDFPALMVDSLKIYRCRRQYSLLLHCRFQVDGTGAFPDVAQKMKEAVFTGMRERFGVENLRKIRIVLTDLEGKDLAKTEPAVSVSMPVSTPGMPSDQL
ncbi:MAG: hypothetical protein IKD46_03255 [Lentisphaeria bacterium]|nr:hypothetical protein [Lentisphaeria bacterium]